MTRTVSGEVSEAPRVVRIGTLDRCSECHATVPATTPIPHKDGCSALAKVVR